MNPIPEFLSREEVTEVDAALLTAQDKFLTRIALYSLRVLKQIAAAESQPISAITDQQIAAWVEQDEALKQTVTTDAAFEQFFIRLVLSSRQPLRQASADLGQPMDALTNRDLIGWFETQAKRRLNT